MISDSCFLLACAFLVASTVFSLSSIMSSIGSCLIIEPEPPLYSGIDSASRISNSSKMSFSGSIVGTLSSSSFNSSNGSSTDFLPIELSFFSDTTITFQIH